MIKRTHIQVWSLQAFKEYLEKKGVGKGKADIVNILLNGLDIIENTYLPSDIAVLINKDGQVLDIIRVGMPSVLNNEKGDSKKE